MGNRIVKVLKKFNVKFKERGDAIEFKVANNTLILVLSAFDDENQLCTYSYTSISSKQIVDKGYATYEGIVQLILDDLINGND